MTYQQEALKLISDSDQHSSRVLNNLAGMSREEISQQVDLALERLEDLPLALALFALGLNTNTTYMSNRSLEILREQKDE